MNFASLAFRNLSRQKRRTIMLALAIGFGVFVVTLVNGFAAGAVRILKENIADMAGGHVFVDREVRENGKTLNLIEDDGEIVEMVRSLGVRDEDITRSISASGNLIFAGRQSMNQVIGLDWGADTDMAKSLGMDAAALENMKANPNYILLSKRAAESLKIEVGDELRLRTQTWNGQPNVGVFVVGFINQDTSQFGEFTSFSSQQYISEVLNLPGTKAYQSMAIKLRGGLDASLPFQIQLKALMQARNIPLKPVEASQGLDFTSSVRRVAQDTVFEGERWEVTTINDFLTEINQLSGGLQIASFTLLIIMLLVTMVGIANTFRMILYERITEIGTLRALGMQRGEVGNLLLFEAFFLALVGVAAGVALAGIAMVILGWVNWGTDSFMAIFLQNGYLSFRIDMGTTLGSLILVSIFTLLAAWGPSRKAAKLAPAVALRSTN